MKKLFLLVAALALLAARADAQTKTTVTATIVDPSGIPYANGSVTATLTPAGVSNPTVGGAAIGGFVGPAVTDNNGHFSMDLFCNSAGGGCSPISPANTKWQFTVCNPGVPSPLGFGNQCFTPAAITITGATQDVSTQMNAVAPLLTRLAGATITPGAPTGACSNGALAIDSTTGVLYTCQSNAWVPVTPTSGVGAPVGSCSPRQLYVDTSTGSLYTCNGGTWQLSTAGAGFTKIQALTITSGICTPGSASSFDACSFSKNWGVAFADANYSAVCWSVDAAANGGDPSTNKAVNIYSDPTGQTAAAIKIIVQNLRSIAQSPGRIDCVGVHP